MKVDEEVCAKTTRRMQGSNQTKTKKDICILAGCKIVDSARARANRITAHKQTPVYGCETINCMQKDVGNERDVKFR